LTSQAEDHDHRGEREQDPKQGDDCQFGQGRIQGPWARRWYRKEGNDEGKSSGKHNPTEPEAPPLPCELVGGGPNNRMKEFIKRAVSALCNPEFPVPPSRPVGRQGPRLRASATRLTHPR
jgi:hypothetical protein